MGNEKSQNFKEVWFGKIETKDLALKVIKECSNGFYCVAAFGVLASFFLGAAYLVDALLFIIFAFLLRKFKSMIVALILSLLSFLGLIFTLMNVFKISKGGTNLLLAIMLLWMSIRAVQATFKLSKL